MSCFGEILPKQSLLGEILNRQDSSPPARRWCAHTCGAGADTRAERRAGSARRVTSARTRALRCAAGAEGHGRTRRRKCSPRSASARHCGFRSGRAEDSRGSAGCRRREQDVLIFRCQHRLTAVSVLSDHFAPCLPTFHQVCHRDAASGWTRDGRGVGQKGPAAAAVPFRGGEPSARVRISVPRWVSEKPPRFESRRAAGSGSLLRGRRPGLPGDPRGRERVAGDGRPVSTSAAGSCVTPGTRVVASMTAVRSFARVLRRTQLEGSDLCHCVFGPKFLAST